MNELIIIHNSYRVDFDCSIFPRDNSAGIISLRVLLFDYSLLLFDNILFRIRVCMCGNINYRDALR